MKQLCLVIGLCSLSAPAFAKCYQEPLDVFFRAFARDIAVQEAVTPERLSLTELDYEADPEPRAIEREVTRADLAWPLVPNQTIFERGGGSVQFQTIDQAHVVTLRGDNGYLTTLIFVQNPCWELQAIKNESM